MKRLGEQRKIGLNQVNSRKASVACVGRFTETGQERKLQKTGCSVCTGKCDFMRPAQMTLTSLMLMNIFLLSVTDRERERE